MCLSRDSIFVMEHFAILDVHQSLNMNIIQNISLGVKQTEVTKTTKANFFPQTALTKTCSKHKQRWTQHVSFSLKYKQVEKTWSKTAWYVVSWKNMKQNGSFSQKNNFKQVEKTWNKITKLFLFLKKKINNPRCLVSGPRPSTSRWWAVPRVARRSYSAWHCNKQPMSTNEMLKKRLDGTRRWLEHVRTKNHMWHSCSFCFENRKVEDLNVQHVIMLRILDLKTHLWLIKDEKN